MAKELEHAHPEISEEFGLVNLELKAGKRRVEALRNLADRTGVDDLKKLVAVLIQADRFGTGVAQSLRAHSDFMRVQARQIAEEKAAKLGVKLVFPIFFCILPSLVRGDGGAGGHEDHAGADPDDEQHVAEIHFRRKGERTMDSSMIRIVCAVLAVLFLGLIVLRRKKSAE